MLKNKKIILILLFIFFNINYSFSMDLYSNKIKDNIEISKFKKVNSNYLFLLNKKNDSLNYQARIRAHFSNIFQNLDNYRILLIEKLPFNYLNDFTLSDNQIGPYQYYISRKIKDIFGVIFNPRLLIFLFEQRVPHSIESNTFLQKVTKHPM